MTLSAPTIDQVRQAADLISPYVRRMPLLPICRGYLKLESLQPTASFKVRGFLAAALHATPAERAQGLTTVSAGNAALACAYAARELGVSCRVRMFDTAPEAKRLGVLRLGGEVLPMPFDEVLEWMHNRGWIDEPGLFIHPFADQQVMAGAGCIGLEVLEDLPHVTRIVLPVGGGGLAVGVAATVKALRPEVEVIGVQSDGYALWRAAFEAGGPVSLRPHTIADGTTGPFHPDMFELLKGAVDAWIVVPEPEVRRAVARLALEARVVAEGAGALAFAALSILEADATTVAVVSGANIDAGRLSEILGEHAAAPST